MTTEYIKKSDAVKALMNANFKNWGNACLVIMDMQAENVIPAKQMRDKEKLLFEENEIDFCRGISDYILENTSIGEGNAERFAVTVFLIKDWLKDYLNKN